MGLASGGNTPVVLIPEAGINPEAMQAALLAEAAQAALLAEERPQIAKVMVPLMPLQGGVVSGLAEVATVGPNGMPTTQYIKVGAPPPRVATVPLAAKALVETEEVSAKVPSPRAPSEEIKCLSPWVVPMKKHGSGLVQVRPGQAMQGKGVVSHAAQTLGAPILPVPMPRAPTEPVTLPPLAATLPPFAKGSLGLVPPLEPAAAFIQPGVETTGNVPLGIPRIATMVDLSSLHTTPTLVIPQLQMPSGSNMVYHPGTATPKNMLGMIGNFAY
jgi:hypothetical protein